MSSGLRPRPAPALARLLTSRTEFLPPMDTRYEGPPGVFPTPVGARPVIGILDETRTLALALATILSPMGASEADVPLSRVPLDTTCSSWGRSASISAVGTLLNVKLIRDSFEVHPPLIVAFSPLPNLPGQCFLFLGQRCRVEQLIQDINKDHPFVCNNLGKRYMGKDGRLKKQALQSLYLAIQSGECFGMLGPSGSGKSTFINMVTGLLQPTSGNAFVNSIDTRSKTNQIYTSIGMCPQKHSNKVRRTSPNIRTSSPI
ncbi:ABC transporter A family member 5 [Acorus calamus]|uniref:ABC transporter A family member 5 n=1 Tax=Acorus calamus TaxID=4465 RepID=A0AAV9DAR0_ACOCL|nr:ABC transporter A family member 5 [Acorus calamus]